MRQVVGTLTAALALGLALGACSGTSGTGGGLSIPQTQPGIGVAPGQQGAGAAPAVNQSRQRVAEADFVLKPGFGALSLPPLEGFSVEIVLGSPAPASAGSASPAPGASASAAASAAPSPKPSASSSAASAGQKIATKLTLYPDSAPAAPTPQASGDVQGGPKRTAIVRGYLMPVADIPLYGLAALRFTIPKSEQTDARGFTVALYTAGKKGHDTLVASDAQAQLADNVVSSGLAAALSLKKGIGYYVMLYGDELPATPEPSGAYVSPGNNPFVTPAPGDFPTAAGEERGYATGPPSGASASPAATQTPH